MDVNYTDNIILIIKQVDRQLIIHIQVIAR